MTSASSTTATLLLVFVVAACPQKPKPADPAPKQPAPTSQSGAPEAAAAPGPMARPPHPAMATSQYGFAALQAMAGSAPAAAGPISVAQGLEKLASAGDGAERAAKDLFLQAFKAAGDDQGRAEAAAGVMLCLVLDPDPKGYPERLTDAYGIQLYTAGIKGSSRLVEGARGVAMAAAGRTADARGMAKRMADQDPKELWLRNAEGMTRSLLGDRGGALLAFRAALDSGQPVPLTYLHRGTVLLLLQDAPAARADAEAALKLNPACSRCALLRAQAMAISPDAITQTQGLAELSRLSSAGLPAYWTAEALIAAAVTEATRDHGQVVEGLATRLRDIREFAPEAALASGLAASAAHNNPAALLALDKAAKTLPPGPYRAVALRQLAQVAVAEGAHAQALEALKGLETEAGLGADTAELAATALAAMKDADAARDETLRAYVLDPYNAARAKAAGRPVRPGGADASAQASRVWRLLGGGAAKEAMAAADVLAKADKANPYPWFAKVLIQRSLDEGAPIGETASKDVILHALEVIKRMGKDAPHTVFHISARRELLQALDEGERSAVQAALDRFAADPDKAVAAFAAEAIKRGAPRARKTAQDSQH